MKTTKNIILIFAACMFFFAGCKDDDLDYRDTWVGSYEGYCEYHSSTGSDYQFDTIYTNESLSVSKQGDDGLTIDYLGQLFPVHCTSEGTFTSTSDNPHSEWNGCIKGDSLFFNYHDVSQGHSSARHFKGKRQNKTITR
jgi:hypothetical protein